MASRQEDVSNGGHGHRPEAKANDERASSCYSSSSSSAVYEDALERAGGRKNGGEESQPPPAQQMDRPPSPSSSSSLREAADPSRIPQSVFARDASDSHKEWSMISTDSVFGIQVAPSGDFTGFFVANPELLDISTPPRTSAADEAALPPHFDTMAEVAGADMAGTNFSFAFPNLIEDARHGSKKAQEEDPPGMPGPPPPAEEAPAQATGGGWLSCLPCCSS